MKEEYKLSHLKELEAESIHIIREVAAEFENPVMLYSIGKDSSVMVRLAEKAFYARLTLDQIQNSNFGKYVQFFRTTQSDLGSYFP